MVELKTSADELNNIDIKLQVWKKINNMINDNIAHFLEINPKNELTALLQQIYDDAGKDVKSVIEQDVKNLRESIQETLDKIASDKD